MTVEAAANLMGKEAGVIAMRALEKQQGVNLRKRKALQAILVLGAAAGGSGNPLVYQRSRMSSEKGIPRTVPFENGKHIDI